MDRAGHDTAWLFCWCCLPKQYRRCHLDVSGCEARFTRTCYSAGLQPRHGACRPYAIWTSRCGCGLFPVPWRERMHKKYLHNISSGTHLPIQGLRRRTSHGHVCHGTRVIYTAQHHDTRLLRRPHTTAGCSAGGFNRAAPLAPLLPSGSTFLQQQPSLRRSIQASIHRCPA